eukprot:355127-Chlamydomonas_euryale.AAC.12
MTVDCIRADSIVADTHGHDAAHVTDAGRSPVAYPQTIAICAAIGSLSHQQPRLASRYVAMLSCAAVCPHACLAGHGNPVQPHAPWQLMHAPLGTATPCNPMHHGSSCSGLAAQPAMSGTCCCFHRH